MPQRHVVNHDNGRPASRTAWDTRVLDFLSHIRRLRLEDRRCYTLRHVDARRGRVLAAVHAESIGIYLKRTYGILDRVRVGEQRRVESCVGGRMHEMPRLMASHVEHLPSPAEHPAIGRWTKKTTHHALRPLRIIDISALGDKNYYLNPFLCLQQ